MSAFSTRVVFFFGVFFASAITAGAVDIKTVTEWANEAGVKLLAFFNNATKYYELQEHYDNSASRLNVEKQDGSEIVRDMTSRLQKILQSKIESIKNLAENTAEVRHKYTFNPSLKKVDYLNTKELPKDYFAFDPKFSQSIRINKNGSVVHIPTDVYSGGRKILNTIAWTNGLDPIFKENDKNYSLLWQYFGSSDGVYRVYPGFKWHNEGQDVYDNRRRGWYIQGSSSPKDIVLLLDLSGRMAGQKLAIVKLAAMSLLETLQENDFVNIVILYSNKDDDKNDKVQPYRVCQVIDSSDEKIAEIEEDKLKAKSCSKDLLQATQQNKKYLKNFVPKLKARGMAAFDGGFRFAIDLLKDSRKNGNTTSSGCSQSIILFTDGIEESQAQKTKDTLKEHNADKKIRVFTYLIGREKSATDQPLKKISGDYYGCTFRIQTLSDVREKVLEYVKILSRPVGFATAGSDPVTSWTPIYLDRLGLGLMITLVAPVFNKSNSGELLGVVGTDVALPQLEGSVPGSKVGVNGYGFVINNNGFVLFHPGLGREKDPPNIALDQVEFNSSKAKELMREMISRETGNMTFKNRVISSNKHRISWSEEFHYFYSPIANTSFSAAVAIPKSSMAFLSVQRDDSLGKEALQKSASDEFVILAPWQICRNTPVAASNTTPVYQPDYATAQDIINDDNYKANCNDTKLKNLLFDANITKEFAKSWIGQKKDGIESIFVATRGGVMRWLNFSSLSSPLKRNFSKEEFYTKAAQFAQLTQSIEKPTVVFSARYRSKGYVPEVNETVSISASSPVILLKGTDRFVVAVLGMEITERKLNEVLFSNGAFNTVPGCSDGSDCVVRVIDDDGFIIATNQKEGSEVGKSFAEVESCVMQELVNNNSFENLSFTSIQEECVKSDNTADSSSARTLLNPLFAVSAYVQFWTQTVFWSLAQFNIYSFFSPRASAMAKNEESKAEMIPCSKKLPFYKAVLESENRVLNCEDPTSSCCGPFIAAIPQTNLRLVVSCHTCESPSPAQKPTDDSQDNQPKPFSTNYRLRPHLACYDRTEDEKPPCALASLASSHFAVVIFSLVVALGADNWR